ncbi:hypothetical protein QQF64_018627, partial [Cirrhinus molitorella]
MWSFTSPSADGTIGCRLEATVSDEQQRARSVSALSQDLTRGICAFVCGGQKGISRFFNHMSLTWALGNENRLRSFPLLCVKMCSLGFARSLGFALIPLATCCIVANVLLFFPDGKMNFIQDDHVTKYVWYFMGIGGGGLAMLVPTCVFLGMGKCADSCGTDSCA